MCSCGHDVDDKNEADSLKKKVVMTSAGAAALAGIPAVFATPAGQSHHVMMLGVIAVQLGLIARAIYLLRQRKLVLARGR